MMPESKSPWRQALLAAYLRRKYRQRFYAVRVGGFEGWEDWLASTAPYPLVLFGNHQTWWDGLLDFSLTREFGMDQRLMMEARNLAQFPFFQKCGVFGVDLESARDRGEGLLHAVRILNEGGSRRCLIIYPQGRLVPDWESVPLQPGLEAIFKRAPQATGLPVWRKIHHGKHELPEVEIQLGEPILPGTSPSLKDLDESLQKTREALILRLNEVNVIAEYTLSRCSKSLRGET